MDDWFAQYPGVLHRCLQVSARRPGASAIHVGHVEEDDQFVRVFRLAEYAAIGNAGCDACRLVRIVDADDASKEMPAGEVGEILLGGPQIMRGYFNAPEGTD